MSSANYFLSTSCSVPLYGELPVLWGRLSTCGRLLIGLSLSLRTLPLKPTLFSMATFHVRRLPHYHPIGQPVFLTWRLHGSLPHNRCFPEATTHGEAFLAMDRLLDNARTGPLYLRMPEIAEMMVIAIRYQDGRHFDLHNFVVMANHVHLLITPRDICFEVNAIAQTVHRARRQQDLGLHRQALLAR
ncbi:MAG TPA: hypothetical protein VKG25_11405 [Bryobacteraceae bacterium]|nr:hypothetical protein [Bryobacteraceae bacterium]